MLKPGIYPNVYIEEVSLLKPVVWMGDSLQRIRGAAVDVRTEAGHQLGLVQGGEMPEDFRPMPDVGPGVVEIRLHGASEFRVFYVARFAEAVYVLHCFEKKTQATRMADLELGRRRLRAVLAHRETMMGGGG